MKVSIVIPAYNEEKRIGATLEAYSNFFETKRVEEDLEYELLVVINNTSDHTEEIVMMAQEKNARICYINLKKGGKGLAVVEGFRDALRRENDLIGFVDADMATTPEEYYRLIENLGRYDGIIASRWTHGAVISPKPSLKRKMARTAFNMLIRSIIFLHYNDTQCGAKLFKRKPVEKITQRVTMSQWAFDVDVLYVCRKENFRILEFPTTWTDKEYSKINFWQAGPKMALGIVRLRILSSPFKNLLGVYDLIYKGVNRFI